MTPDISSDAMKRLAYIEGHLNGVRKMLEEDRYCVDILKQTHAIRKAIEKFESLLLDGHLRTCVVDGIQKGKAEKIIEEPIFDETPASMDDFDFMDEIDFDDSEDIHLELASCYAFEREKFLSRRIEIGENLIGQVFLEKKTEVRLQVYKPNIYT